MITGGRDIDPKHYNQENTKSILDEESNVRFNFIKTIVDCLPKNIPIMGICYGAQFLNVYYGGSLI